MPESDNQFLNSRHVEICLSQCRQDIRCEIFTRSNTGIMGSKPIGRKDVYVYSVLVFPCVDSGLAALWASVQGVLPTVYKIIGEVVLVLQLNTMPYRCMEEWV
jgi:hypothetical protein